MENHTLYPRLAASRRRKALINIFILLSPLMFAYLFVSFPSWSNALNDHPTDLPACHQTFLPISTGDMYLESCNQANDYCELNNSIETAYGPLAPGISYRALTNDSDDFYYFNLTESSHVTINVSEFKAVGQVMLYDSSEQRVDYQSIDPGGNGSFEVDLNPDKYYVRLFIENVYSMDLYNLVVTYPYPETETEPPICVPKDEPKLPVEYEIYDDFDGLGEPNPEKWTRFGHNMEQCDSFQNNGRLQLSCEGLSVEDVFLGYFVPEMSIDGLAVAAEIAEGDELGEFDVSAQFFDSDGLQQRSYFLAMGVDYLKVVEFYPQNDWKLETLAEIDISPGAHVLKIEHNNGKLEFFVDDSMIQLTTLPNLADNYVWVNWAIQDYVLPSHNQSPQTLESVVYWTAISQPVGRDPTLSTIQK